MKKREQAQRCASLAVAVVFCFACIAMAKADETKTGEANEHAKLLTASAGASVELFALLRRAQTELRAAFTVASSEDTAIGPALPKLDQVILDKLERRDESNISKVQCVHYEWMKQSPIMWH